MSLFCSDYAGVWCLFRLRLILFWRRRRFFSSVIVFSCCCWSIPVLGLAHSPPFWCLCTCLLYARLISIINEWVPFRPVGIVVPKLRENHLSLSMLNALSFTPICCEIRGPTWVALPCDSSWHGDRGVPLESA